MTKTYLINSSMAVLATAFMFTASLSSANAGGWGKDGQYGNTPAPGQTQSAPGYGGGQSGRPSWPRPTGSYGSYQTNGYPGRPCRGCSSTYPRDTSNNGGGYGSQYNDGPNHGTVYVPPRRDTYNNGGGYHPNGGGTYNNGGGYNPNRGTVYVPPRRDTWNNGGGYGGSQSSGSNWNTSGGYGGRR